MRKLIVFSAVIIAATYAAIYLSPSPESHGEGARAAPTAKNQEGRRASKARGTAKFDTDVPTSDEASPETSGSTATEALSSQTVGYGETEVGTASESDEADSLRQTRPGAEIDDPTADLKHEMTPKELSDRSDIEEVAGTSSDAPSESHHSSPADHGGAGDVSDEGLNAGTSDGSGYAPSTGASDAHDIEVRAPEIIPPEYGNLGEETAPAEQGNEVPEESTRP